MRQLLYLSFVWATSASVLQPRFSNSTTLLSTLPTTSTSASPQQNAATNVATSTASFPSGTTTTGPTSILLTPTLPLISCTTSCAVNFPSMSSIVWSSLTFDNTTTSNFTAATWVTYVDSLHNLTSSTLVTASTTPAGVFNKTQVATVTLSVGQNVISTALVTYPSNYIAYNPDYGVYGIFPTYTTLSNFTPPVTSSVCEDFETGTTIFPSSHPTFPAPPPTSTDPNDPLGLDYTATWENIVTPSIDFFQSEFTDQFAYTGCSPPPFISTTSITFPTNPSTKTSVAVLTASTVIATNLAQQSSGIGSGGGSGGGGSPGVSNNGGGSSGSSGGSTGGNEGGSSGNGGGSSGNTGGSSGSNGGSSSENGGGSSSSSGNSGSNGGSSGGNGGSSGSSGSSSGNSGSGGSSSGGSSNGGSSNGGSSNGGSSSGGSSNGGSSGGSSSSGSDSGGLGAVIVSALGFGGSPSATPQAQTNGNSGSGSGSNSGTSNNGGAQPAGAGAPAGAQGVTIGGSSVLAVPTTAANGAPAVVVGGQTGTIGQTLIVNGNPVVVGGSSATPQLIVGGNANSPAQTIALTTPAPGSNGGNAVATTINGQPAVVVGGITAAVGQSVTVGGQVGQVVTSGSVTEIVFPGSGGSSPSTSIVGAAGAGSGSSTAGSTPAISTVAAPVATLNAVPTTISGKPEVVIGGSITASIGQTVMISGTPVVVTTSGSSTELIFGGTSTSIVHKPTSTSGASSTSSKHRQFGGFIASVILALGFMAW